MNNQINILSKLINQKILRDNEVEIMQPKENFFIISFIKADYSDIIKRHTITIKIQYKADEWNFDEAKVFDFFLSQIIEKKYIIIQKIDRSTLCFEGFFFGK